MNAESLVNGKTLNTTSVLFSASVLIVAVYFINYLWQRRWLYYHVSKMSGPFAWPIIGNALQFVGGLDELLETLMWQIRKYKPIFRCWIGNRPFVFITKPEDVEIVINRALDKGTTYHVLKQALGNGLITAPVPIWKKNRKMISPSFNQKILNSFVDKFVKQSQVLLRRLNEQSGTIDIYPFLYTCTLDQIFETAIGCELNAQEFDNPYAFWITRAMEIIYGRVFTIWQQPSVLWKINPLCKELDTIVGNARRDIEKTIRNSNINNNIDEDSEIHNDDEASFRNKTFIQCIEKEAAGTDFDKIQLRDEIVTMVTAGSETSASTDAFALIMMGMHPEIQEKVYAEQKEIFGDNLDELTSADLPKMKYLERVIKETLRLFPLAPMIFREISEDINLENYVVPKGCVCAIPPIVMHRDPEYWSDPMKFDPERFLPENVTQRHPYSYIPFSAGPRNCIGMNYAMMSMKTVLSMVVRNFIVTTEYKAIEEIRLRPEIVLKCIDGYKIAVRRRS